MSLARTRTALQLAASALGKAAGPRTLRDSGWRWLPVGHWRRAARAPLSESEARGHCGAWCKLPHSVAARSAWRPSARRHICQLGPIGNVSWSRRATGTGGVQWASAGPGPQVPVCTVQGTVTVSGAREVACLPETRRLSLTKPQRPACLHRLLPESDANCERSCDVHIIDKLLEHNNAALLSSDGSEHLIG